MSPSAKRELPLHIIKKLAVSKTENSLVKSRNGVRFKVESPESDPHVPSAKFLRGNTVKTIQLCMGGSARKADSFLFL